MELANPTNFTWRELMDFTYDVRVAWVCVCVYYPCGWSGRSYPNQHLTDPIPSSHHPPPTSNKHQQITRQTPRVVDVPQTVGEVAASVLEQMPNPILTVHRAWGD